MTKLKLGKRSAVFLILAAAVALAAVVLLCGGPGGRLETREDRVAYLAALGWEVDPASEELRETALPRAFDSVLARYNELQKQQGFDLLRYAGLSCQVYSYRLTSYPNGDANVIAQLILCEGRVIGGDIHAAALDGFMHGLK